MKLKNPKTLIALRVFSLALLSLTGLNITAQSDHNVTAQMVEGGMTELSNWGRWGADDELGTLNLITPQKRIEAAQLVRSGISVSLAHNYSKASGSAPTPAFDHEVFSIS